MRSPFLLLIAILALTSCVMQAQDHTKLEKMGKLPKRIDESSGLAIAGKHSLWTHNDSGSKAEFYEIDIHGDLLRVVQLDGVKPVDIEDLGQDEDGVLYFADTGNNKKERKSLKIYIVDPKEIESGRVEASTIEFILPAAGLQSECHYDFEAIVVSQGLVYLFSKDRCNEKNNSLHYFTVPADTGKFVADYQGEFFWNDPNQAIQITSADISTDGRKLVLLSKDALHIFYDYRKDKFFRGAYLYVPIKKSQREAIAHLNECEIYITEEAKKNEPAFIYRLNLCKVKFD
jgi:hypothetical protein